MLEAMKRTYRDDEDIARKLEKGWHLYEKLTKRLNGSSCSSRKLQGH
jgi:hypothetical protein